MTHQRSRAHLGNVSRETFLSTGIIMRYEALGVPNGSDFAFPVARGRMIDDFLTF